MRFLSLLFFLLPVALSGQEWRDLFNGRDLTGWEVRGSSIWTVLPGGILAGQRVQPDVKSFEWPLTQRQFQAWRYKQSWLYTRDDFEEFDLEVDYWIPAGGNSGISIRDTSRGRVAVEGGPTPAHIGYEIQICDDERYPSGSLYTFAKAEANYHRKNDWNKLEIQSRRNLIRIRLNGQFTAEHPGDPSRPKAGPIGLQLHDQFSWALFRNIRIRPLKR